MNPALTARLSFLSLLCASLLPGCGGGDSRGTLALNYSGIRSVAVITTNNAEALAQASFTQGASAGNDSPPVAALAMRQAGSDPALLSTAAQLARRLRADVETALITSSDGHTRTVVAFQQSTTVLGNCGGSKVITVNIDDTTGNSRGETLYRGYCDNGVTTTGSMGFSLIKASGQMTVIYRYLNREVAALSGDAPVEHTVTSGSIRYNLYADTPAMTVNLLLQNNAGKVFKIEDLVITMVDGGTYLDVAMNGRVYHPDYGYVDLRTVTPMRTPAGTGHPASGVYVLTGAHGATVTMTAYPNRYRLDLDLDGDGLYDSAAITSSWTALH